MSDIRTRPVTPEYEETWDRVFGKRIDSHTLDKLSRSCKKTLDTHFKHLGNYSFTGK